MPRSQVERLKRDYHELSHYIKRLKKEGDQTKVYKMIKKREFIDRQISDLEEYFH
jgi:uncharacterized membrane protein (DUF106 family)